MKNSVVFNTGILFILLTIISCSQTTSTNNCRQSDVELDAKYSAAVEDARTIEQSEISNKLIAIIDSGSNSSYLQWKTINGERWVLVTTFMDSIRTGKYIIDYNSQIIDVLDSIYCWVTVVPELKNFFKKKLVCDNDYALRIKQLLGLPYYSNHSYFVEMWIKPNDLFRPSHDPEINDNVAELNFRDTISTDYRNWFFNNYESSFNNSNPHYRYPWTQLGYTYDWYDASKTVIGLSEFIIKPKSSFVVNKVYTISEYLFK